MARRKGGDKIHNRKKEQKKKDLKRKVADKKTVPDIIIACEDRVRLQVFVVMRI